MDISAIGDRLWKSVVLSAQTVNEAGTRRDHPDATPDAELKASSSIVGRKGPASLPSRNTTFPVFGASADEIGDANLVLLKVPDPGHPDWHDDRACHIFKDVQLYISGESLIVNPEPSQELQFDFSIISIKLNPQIELAWRIQDMDNIVGSGNVRIPLALVMHDGAHKSYASHITAEMTSTKDDDCLVIRMTVLGIISSSLWLAREALSPLRVLQDYSEDGHSIEIHIRAAHQDDSELNLLRVLFELIDARVHPFTDSIYSYQSYRGRHGQNHVQSSRPRKLVLTDAHPGLQLDPVVRFVDNEEACARLLFGCNLDFAAERHLLEAVARDKHHFVFMSVGKYKLAMITFVAPVNCSDKHEQLSLREGTRVKLELYNKRDRYRGHGWNDDEDEEQPGGIVIANTLDLPSCDVLVHINRNAPSMSNFMDLPKHRSMFRVIPDIIFTTHSTRSNAVDKAYGSDAHGEAFRQRWSALLSRGGPAKDVNVFLEAHVPAKLNESARDMVRRAAKWDDCQFNVFRSIFCMPGRIVLVNSVSGSGKTTLLVYLAAIFKLVGFNVVIVGARNEAVNWLCDAYNKVSKEQILRVFPVSSESLNKLALVNRPDESESRPQHDSFPTTGDGLLAELIAEADHRSSGRSSSSNLLTVLKAVSEALKSNVKLMRRFADSRGDKLDMYEYLRNALKEAAEVPFSNRNVWHGKRWKECREAYMFARQEVLKNARVVACTPVVSAEEAFRLHFGRDSGRKVIVLYDEASCMNEPDALAPLSATWNDYGQHVLGVFMFGDIQQLGPHSTGGTKQGTATNEFHHQFSMSLMERLIASGHPSSMLTTQRRMARVIFEPANASFYGSQIMSAEEPRLALNAAESTLLGKIAGYDDGQAASMTDAQRRLLYVVVGDAQTRISRSTKSSANLENLNFVIAKLPLIREVYGKKVKENVTIFTPYSMQVALYKQAMMRLRRQGWTSDELPNVLTIDKASGHEYTMSIVDTVVLEREAFLVDRRRVCVMFTRARKMQLIVSGNFSKVASTPRPRTFVTADGGRITNELVAPLLHYKNYYQQMDALLPIHGADYKPTKVPQDLSEIDVEEDEDEDEE